MTERECFLRAICENPADDTARLVYADWLDEQDDANCRDCATWIREQMQNGDTRDDMNLWVAACMFHCDPSAWGLGMSQGGCKIRRGLIDEVSVTIERFMRIAKPLFATQPITSVTLTDLRPTRSGPLTFIWYDLLNNQMMTASPFIPGNIATFLMGYRTPMAKRRGLRRLSYHSLKAAQAALSRAAVDYGRWLAGLPRLYGVGAGAVEVKS